MNCPYCASSTKVTNSRSTSKETRVWRRRQCSNCQKIWTTTEIIDLSKSHKVKHTENDIESFSRDKLFISIKDSLQHRKSSLEEASALTDTILGLVIGQSKAILEKETLIKLCYDVIRRFDKTAAAVYRATYKS